jgi:uncharacterized MAPEG superfamily protein
MANPTPPPAEILFLNFLVLGAIVSYLFGRRIPVASSSSSLLPDDILLEVCPSMIVICIFLTTYNLYDAMPCGLSKKRAKLDTTKYTDWPTKMPEDVYLAERVQSNQVEQMTPFIVSTLFFSIVVNGTVGAILSLMWVILRRLYAHKYRSSVGITMENKNIGSYTVPCYFIINTMSMGSVVHAIRYMYSVYY